MKLSYKYIDKGFTMVRLDDRLDRVTKVISGQIVESDRDPSYFLRAGFVSVDTRNKEELKYATAKMKAQKINDELENSEGVSERTKVTLDVRSMKLEEIKEELKKMGIKFVHNTKKDKLVEKLVEAKLS